MLCQVCLGVLQEGRNPAYYDESSGSITPTRKDTNVSDVPSQDLPVDDDSSCDSGKTNTFCFLMRFSKSKRQVEHFGHHRTLVSLRNSVESKCRVCSRAWNNMSEARRCSLRDVEISQTEVAADSDRFLTWARVTAYDRSVNLRIKLKWESSQRVLSVAAFSLYPNYDKRPEFPAPTSDCTGSSESLSIAKGWLLQCIDSHDKCTPEPRVCPWYPTRLLDLGETNQEVDSIRLIHTRNQAVDGPYTTLSHRWGGTDFLQLTHRNIDRLCSALPILDLPRTFQEAITVSRTLQVRYLWIDSLCIRQDRLSDWAAEASQMDKVYSNSYCNISATDASDSSEGLFRRREPHLIQETAIELCSDTRCKIRKAHAAYLLSNCDFFTGLEKAPLHQRGWVFQERVLAPRVLHFCGEQIFWECRSHTLCEQYPRDIPTEIFADLNNAFFKANRAYLEDDVGLWYKFWDQIVEEYAGTILTLPSDKLVALSGIAKLVRSKIDDVYVAGLWSKSLPQKLMWVPLGTAARAPLYRAPSWSWACLEGYVGTASISDDCSSWTTTVEDFHLDYTTDDNTGQVCGGWLDLKGFLRPMTLEKKSCPTQWRLALSARSGAVRRQLQDMIILDDDSVEEETVLQRSATKEYFGMPCLRTDDDDVRYNFFYLLRLVDTEEALYERAGMIFNCENTLVRSMLDEYDEESLKSIRCLRYEDGKHTIRII